ncbi:YdeI/OmpD-associated family protein [Akkermansia muciniphila]|nr:YdeI/OmpD-associated family protein [Akkermansia muciniphila]
MEKLGKMTEAGRSALPDMSSAGFIIDKEILKALQTDNEVWENFLKFPPLYQRVRIDTIQIKRNNHNFFKADYKS